MRHVGEEVVLRGGFRLRHLLLIVLFPLHLRVNVAGSDDQMPAVLVLQQCRLHAGVGRFSSDHQPVLHGETAVPLQNGHNLLFGEDPHETVFIFRIDDPVHVLSAQVKEVPAGCLNAELIKRSGGTVQDKFICVRLDNVDAEIVSCQRLRNAAVSDSRIMRLPECLLRPYLIIDTADPDHGVPSLFFDHPGDFEVDISGFARKHHAEGECIDPVVVQRCDHICFREAIQKHFSVIRIDEQLEPLP